MNSRILELLNTITPKTLLIYLTIGFLTGFDFTDLLGCVFFIDFFFLNPLSLLTAISILVVYIAYKSEDQGFSKFILLAEFLYFLSRLILVKGGYATGFAGTPDLIILFYDAGAILIRIILLTQLFAKNLKLFPLFFFLGGVLFVKSYYFAIPPYYYYQQEKDIVKGRIIQEEMQGRYIGQLMYGSEQEIISDNTVVEIYKDSISIVDNLFENEGKYFLLLESEDFGIIRNDTFENSIYINEFNNKVLDFNFYFPEYYSFKMKLIE